MVAKLKLSVFCLISALFLNLASTVSVAFWAPPADATGSDVLYSRKGQNFVGYLAQPEGVNKSTPGILVVHDWLGVTQKTKDVVEKLATLGYIAMAVDIYGADVRPSTAEEAGKLAGKYKSDRKQFRERLLYGLEELQKIKGVDSSRLAATGYCFGGTGAIELARSGAKIKGVVSFHGGLDSPEPALGKKIRAKILALHGADDPSVKAEDLTAFESEMRSAKVDWQLVKFGGAVHSFTDKTAGSDNSKGAAYNEIADRRSWQLMQDFLRETL